MPASLSTIMYISDYAERASNNYFVGTAIGHTRLGEEEEDVQSFTMTIFYPIDGNSCYVPKLKEGQVISVGSSKFTKGTENRIDVCIIQYIFISNSFF